MADDEETELRRCRVWHSFFRARIGGFKEDSAGDEPTWEMSDVDKSSSRPDPVTSVEGVTAGKADGQHRTDAMAFVASAGPQSGT